MSRSAWNISLPLCALPSEFRNGDTIISYFTIRIIGLPPICLRSFLNVCDTGGFTETARHLNAIQSTISGHIKRLKKQTGHRFMEHDGGGSVALTLQGRELVGYAREILRLDQEVRLRPAIPSLASHSTKCTAGAVLLVPSGSNAT
ncbi:LysR family transcriptional regulator [Gluconobacter thailandicus]|uniref:LysR family transcriptional regulator n=1 Tax=Gluconobacter thailandicus TaxID=257438 RepID=A0AAP9EPC0_GLUTH|nr:LysR family transcriptional regulator [Gluconobacter thailandicus]